MQENMCQVSFHCPFLQPGVKIPTEPCIKCECGTDIDPQTKLHVVTCSSLNCTPCAEVTIRAYACDLYITITL